MSTENSPKTQVTESVGVEKFLTVVEFLKNNTHLIEYRKWYRQPLIMANNVGGTIRYRVAIVLLDLIEKRKEE